MNFVFRGTSNKWSIIDHEKSFFLTSATKIAGGNRSPKLKNTSLTIFLSFVSYIHTKFVNNHLF